MQTLHPGGPLDPDPGTPLSPDPNLIRIRNTDNNRSGKQFCISVQQVDYYLLLPSVLLLSLKWASNKYSFTKLLLFPVFTICVHCTFYHFVPALMNSVP